MANDKVEKSVLKQLRRFAEVFREARDRGTNEADTVMYLVKFFEEVLGYDSLKGEISKEHQIKDKYCDLALKIDGLVHILVEGKAASVKGLNAKHIEQAENYGSKSGIRWVILSNGIEWQLYHLTFAENEGITHDLAWEANLLEEVDADPEGLWAKLSLLNRTAVQKDFLEEYWLHRKALSPAAIVRVLFSTPVLLRVRQELNRNAPARLDLQDVFNAVRDALSKEALLSAGDINLPKRKKKKKVVRAKSPEDMVGEQPAADDTAEAPSIPFPTQQPAQPSGEEAGDRGAAL